MELNLKRILILSILHLILETNAQSKQYWNEYAQKNLEKILNKKINTNKAKNVILFVGDGMGISSITAGRILKGQKEGKLGEEATLNFDNFHHIGLSKTYTTDKTVADSAETATAMLCGVKTKYNTVGVDDNILTGNCSTVKHAKCHCIGEWALEAGKSAGLVTNMRVTHATPAPLYSASAHRDWEYDAEMPKDADECQDIAKQLIFGYPGKNLQIIMGGGRANFLPNNVQDPEYSKLFGQRADGLNLIDKWKEMRKKENATYAYAWNKHQFDEIDESSTDYILGLFEHDHMKDVTVAKDSEYQEPTLKEMTEKAIKLLQKNKRGYFLLVEGGLIDDFHHENLAVQAISEVLQFDEAIGSALKLTSPEDTLIVVTSDHSHGVALSGYPNRGDNLFGANTISNVDNMPFTSLLYTTGPGYSRNNVTGRENLTNVNTNSNKYVFQAAVPRSSTAHNGEDVASYSHGPMAHLLVGVYEQNYISHVMAYAAQIGPYKKDRNKKLLKSKNSHGDNSSSRSKPTFILFLIFIILFY